MLKDNKGISLTTMVMTLILMIILLTTISFSASDSLNIRRINKFYNDLRVLNDAISVYYLEHKEQLPIIDEPIVITVGMERLPRGAAGVVLKSDKFNTKNDLININDYDETEGTGKAVYYKLNLDLLDVTLENARGTYWINEQSHTVYFVDGITADKKAYHSLPIKYKDVSQGIRPAVTSITAKTVYIPTGGVSVDLKDYLEFNSSEGKNGVPRTLTFTELTRH